MNWLNTLNIRAAPMSYGLIACFVLVYLVQVGVQFQLSGFNQRIGSETLYTLGANFTPAFAAGQYWRILTSCFLHLDLLHLGMNSLALHYFGPILERSFGSKKLLLGFLLTGTLGSLLTSLMHLNEPYLSAGASGGLYGLFGILFITGKRYRAALPPGFQIWLNQTLGLFVVFSFAPFIDMWGHFGGLGAGLLLGWFYRPLPVDPAEAAAGMASAELSEQNSEQKPDPPGV